MPGALVPRPRSRVGYHGWQEPLRQPKGAEQAGRLPSRQEDVCLRSQALSSAEHHPSLQLSPFSQSLGGVLSEQGLEPHWSYRDAPVESGR